MDLGLFSISLTGSDLEVSRDFYEKLGFEVTGGDADQDYLTLLNGTTVIGLFQGMFEKNILTFNPGPTQDGGTPDSFTDVRELQATLRDRSLEPLAEVDESSTGPGHFVLEAPDGNRILVDQFS